MGGGVGGTAAAGGQALGLQLVELPARSHLHFLILGAAVVEAVHGAPRGLHAQIHGSFLSGNGGRMHWYNAGGFAANGANRNGRQALHLGRKTQRAAASRSGWRGSDGNGMQEACGRLMAVHGVNILLQADIDGRLAGRGGGLHHWWLAGGTKAVLRLNGIHALAVLVHLLPVSGIGSRSRCSGSTCMVAWEEEVWGQLEGRLVRYTAHHAEEGQGGGWVGQIAGIAQQRHMWMTRHLLLLLLMMMVVQMGGHVPKSGSVWRAHRGRGRRGTTHRYATR